MNPDAPTAGDPATDPPNILFVEHDVLVRVAMTDYLRECGYLVVDATSAREAIDLLRSRAAEFDIVFAAMDSPGDIDVFALSRWVRQHAPAIRVVLAGSLGKAAKAAGELCEQGPHLRKPYERESLLDWIRRLRAPQLR